MLSKLFNTVIFVFVFEVLAVSCDSHNSTFLNKRSRHRQKRTLNFYFPYNSCYALAVVMVVPLEDLPASRSVFFSWNFETNFYYPYYDEANGIIPLPFTYIDEPGANAGTKHRIDLPPGYRQFSDDGEESKRNRNNKETEETEITDISVKFKNGTGTPLKMQQRKDEKAQRKSRKIRTLLNNYFMSRRRFYKLMESKMDRSGLNGRDCLLKAICETSETSFGFNNGVIGSVVDILFLPSASKDENLPKRYYRAEANGKMRNCATYIKTCPKSIFEFISKII